ncbi:MAG: NRAMP family divalent metal transporter [Terriglobales bacterium]
MPSGPAAVSGPGAITHEDLDRAQDRFRVFAARRRHGGGARLWLLWLLIGPGVLVMLGENDAPSMLAYAATGAKFGIGFFVPFVVLTFIMAIVVQEMTVRLGAATHRGHAELIFDRFGPFWGWFAMGDLLIGNFLTLVTEFIGITAGLGFFGIPAPVAVLGALVITAILLTTHRYWTWERVTLGLAIFNLVFVPIAVFTHPHWRLVGSALATWQPLPNGLNSSTLLILLADIGATVTPWMLFFQQSAVVDKGLTPRDISMGQWDTRLGAVLAAVAAVATIVLTSSLYDHGISSHNFQTAQFAQALEPYIGHWGAALFALGIFEAGLVACIAISTSSAYAFGEVTGNPHSLNRPFREGWLFYSVLMLGACVAAGIVLIPHMPLEYVVLIVNVVAVLAMPPALLFLYLLVNDRELMGDFTNPRWTNIATTAVVVTLVAAGLLFGLATVAPHAFARWF